MMSPLFGGRLLWSSCLPHWLIHTLVDGHTHSVKTVGGVSLSLMNYIHYSIHVHLLCIYLYIHSFIHLCYTNIYRTIDIYSNIYIQIHAFEVARPPKVLSDIKFEALESGPTPTWENSVWRKSKSALLMAVANNSCRPHWRNVTRKVETGGFQPNNRVKHRKMLEQQQQHHL